MVILLGEHSGGVVWYKWLEGNIRKASESTGNVLFIWMLVKLLVFNLWKFIKLNTFSVPSYVIFQFQNSKAINPLLCLTPSPPTPKPFARLLIAPFSFIDCALKHLLKDYFKRNWDKTSFVNNKTLTKFPLPQPNVYHPSSLFFHMKTEKQKLKIWMRDLNCIKSLGRNEYAQQMNPKGQSWTMNHSTSHAVSIKQRSKQCGY